MSGPHRMMSGASAIGANDQLKALLVPFKDAALTMWPVNGQRIANVRNKDREVALPEALP